MVARVLVEVLVERLLLLQLPNLLRLHADHRRAGKVLVEELVRRLLLLRLPRLLQLPIDH